VAVQSRYRISGHETFALRYAWLPKCVEAVTARGGDRIFADEDRAMVELGVGKNMVRAMRFWGEATGILNSTEPGHYSVTGFGKALLKPRKGLDPYLEDDQTLWLLHWKLSTGERPLFAWDFLLNRWHEPELMPSSVVLAAKRELADAGMRVSENSLRSHLVVFLHTYCPTAGTKKASAEETLDCPLVELRLLERRCTRLSIHGKQEGVFAFRRGSKPEIGEGLFVFALLDFWRRTAPNEKTISMRELAFGPGGLGQVFKLDERDIRERLGRLDAPGLSYSESSLIQAVHRETELSSTVLMRALRGVYS